MVTFENMCVDCGLPCQGKSCRYQNVAVYKCDDCLCELDEYYYNVDGMLCEECCLQNFREYF